MIQTGNTAPYTLFTKILLCLKVLCHACVSVPLHACTCVHMHRNADALRSQKRVLGFLDLE